MLITSKGIWYTTPKKKVPSFERTRVINLLSKSGAEGQSRTDTGSPLPVFEFDAMPSQK